MFLSTGIRARYLLKIFRNICLIILFKTLHTHCFKISPTPAVLLAYYEGGLPSNFTLKVTGAKEDECFEFKSSNERVINVTPLLENGYNCSREVILSSVANLLNRQITEISVTSKNKGPETVYCHVYTDEIARIELQYISNELILGGPPQKISIIAKDKHGHTFDSINGLLINWKIVQKAEGEEDTDEIIRVETLEEPFSYESPYNDLKGRGFNSTSILVEALKLGRVFISASLQHSSKQLHSEEIELKVVPNLMIHPESPLYMLRQTTVSLSLKKYRNEEAVLKDFTVDVDGSDVINLAEDLSHLEAKEYGDASVVFNKNSIETASLDVHVVKLARIGITISSGNNTILEEMKVYEVRLDLFDELGNYIFPSEVWKYSIS